MADRSTNRQDRRGSSAHRSEFAVELDERARRSNSRESQQENRHHDRTPTGRQFLFIDANADRTTSSEAVRVHVMRESHRNRREQQSNQTVGHTRNRRAPAQDEMVILDIRQPIRPASTTPPVTARSGTTSYVPMASQPIDWPAVIRTGVSHLSLESMQELERLAEGYIRSIRLVQPDVLHVCKGDFLSMSAYLALAALQLGSSEHEPTNMASAQFEARALELLQIRITQTVQMHADTTLVAVLLLSQLEHKDNMESAYYHRNALRKLIYDRGGLDSVRAQNGELFDILSEAGFVEAIG